MTQANQTAGRGHQSIPTLTAVSLLAIPGLNISTLAWRVRIVQRLCRRSRYVHVAVPDAVSDELVERVFDSYVASQPGFGDIAQLQLEETDSPLGPGWQLGMDLFVVRNYSDVVFGDYFHGRDFTGDPRVVYATGPGGVAHGYNPVSDQDSSYGTVVHESGRDGADLPEDCIAIDFSFRILSQSTTDQLKAYYSVDSPFHSRLE